MHNKAKQKLLAVKSIAEDGTFEGLLSPYGNVDDGGDMVERGAFTKSMAEHGNTVPMLWQHKADCPIGELTLDDRADGLWVKGRLLLDDDVPEAKKAYALLKGQIIKGLSIGYDAVQKSVVDGVRHLKELRLWEGSVVTFPMNTSALISSVKSREQKGDFLEELADRQVSDAGYQMMTALQYALSPLVWSGLSRDEMMTAAETICDQFKATYLEYLPEYLDYLAREYGMDTKSWQGKREEKSREIKAGRKLSGETRDTLGDAHEHIKSAVGLLDDLLETDDGDPDPEDDAEAKSAGDAIQSMRKLLTQ